MTKQDTGVLGTFTDGMSPKDMRILVRSLVPTCTSPRKHVVQATKAAGQVTACAHKEGKRIIA